MALWRSPRQRRDSRRRLRRQRELAEMEARLAPLREEIAATRTLTTTTLLAERYGVDAVPVLLRGGRGVAAIGDGWRVVGGLDVVRAELEHRTGLLAPAAPGMAALPPGYCELCRKPLSVCRCPLSMAPAGGRLLPGPPRRGRAGEARGRAG